MARRIALLRTAAAVAAALFLTSSPPAAADQPGLTVFAAASLREAFEAAALAFAKQTGIKVTFAFGGSDMLVTQLRQGAPADVFASANEAQMKVASDAGLLAAPARTFARNHLVVIVPKDNPAKIAALADLAKPGVKVVLAAATVPVGSYARTAFRKLNGAQGFPADFSGFVERNVVSNELDVKAVATKIALGEGDAGVVYATDVTPNVATKVSTIPFPPGAAPPANYPVAPLKAAANAPGARAFVAFILSPAGQAFLRARGFAAP
ncbi:MAG: molybdate ABC transporter substrate-binding protein [Candidatus Eremiobacteraeota bacterium]|nr:molybdate ABC transporter substrate-binding protein [Candidatus Eremiobacteraeota bacterium]